MPTKIILHTDGAAKGNPGRAGIGIALYREGESEPFATVAEPIDDTTNNVAEYAALLRGLKEALLHGADSVEARTDSELMTKQISGAYKVSSPHLALLHREAITLLARFSQAKVVHVPRAQNALADKLANQGVAARNTKPARTVAKKATPETKPAKAKEETREEKQYPVFDHTHSHTENGIKHVWNVHRLWELAKTLPTKQVPLTQFDSLLETDGWFCGTLPTLRKVANHAKRIYNADFSHPIILAADGRLMDGGHRIARAYLEGRTEIDAVQFPTDPEPDYTRPED